MAGAERANKATTKGSLLQDLLSAPGLSYLMEAHNAVSAKVVDAHDFDGIWASGLTIATSLGMRDCNEASWTQVIDIVEGIVNASSLPVLVDGDTGFGNFNNVRTLVRKLCARDAAGVCLEDKQFPKLNSFVSGTTALAPMPEFCGKIKAACDARTHDGFCIVARVEALVVGLNLDEALERAEAYHAAGATAILIHSRQHTPDEILSFAGNWNRRCPLVVVPTSYPMVTTAELESAGISTVIWANHNMRASIAAMTSLCAEVQKTRSVLDQESAIASMAELLQLFDHEELAKAESAYGWFDPQGQSSSRG